MEDLVSTVRYFNRLIRNGRNQRDIAKALRGEVDELDVEIEKVENNEAPGDDGIVGENIDIIACALDSIFEAAPNITGAELNAIMIRKCEKWARKYGDLDYSQRRD